MTIRNIDEVKTGNVVKIRNRRKLPDTVAKNENRGIRILLFGAGAVGSLTLEQMIKAGYINITVADKDDYHTENIMKGSFLYHYDEDDGEKKATTLAKRAQPLVDEVGGKIHGVNTDFAKIGPMVLQEFDVIILVPDNYAIKLLVNAMWLQIPKEKRPPLIVAGTDLESAQANCLTGEGLCYRCLCDESYLKNPTEKTSCGQAQLRMSNGIEEIVQTTGLASSICANEIVECIRDYHERNTLRNKRICYTAYPNLSLKEVYPIPRKSCPDCKNYHSPVELRYLHGDMMSMTAEKLIHLVQEDLGTDEFEIRIADYDYAKVHYGALITKCYCKSCAKKLPIVRHEFYTYEKDLYCDDCRKSMNTKNADYVPEIEVIRAFGVDDIKEEWTNRTLYELGWQLGGYIEVVKRPRHSFGIFDPNYYEEHVTYGFPGDIHVFDTVNELD